MPIKQYKGNIWDFHQKGWFVLITTNLIIKQNGRAVMGAGIAKQARDSFKDLDLRYAKALRKKEPLYFEKANRLVLFPTKHNYKEDSDIELIIENLKKLAKYPMIPIAMPKLGCANGNLNWEDVYPHIERELGHFENLYIVDFNF